jgi:hypothetical protein
MGLTERDGVAVAAGRDRRPDARVLIISPESVHLQRRLGPLAWTVLQHLALACHRTEGGWAAAVGVRDIAFSIGVTKDTAARAVSTLRAAGLVTGELIECNEKRRSGYQLRLPPEMRLIDCPDHMDSTDNGALGSPIPNPSGDHSSRAQCEPDCPEGDYTPGRMRLPAPAGDVVVLRGNESQPALFDEELVRDVDLQSALSEVTGGASYG